MPIKIVALPGSTRRESFNQKLVTLAAKIAREAGAEVDLLNLRDFPMPIYDGDLEAEQGIPEHGKRLKEIFRASDGILISSPEYNSSISGVLKNAIDWISRPEKGEPSLVAFTGKVAALMSASPGALGGLRALVTVRSILGSINVTVIPEQLSIPKANEAFTPGGEFKDEAQKKKLDTLVRRFVEVTTKLRA